MLKPNNILHKWSVTGRLTRWHFDLNIFLRYIIPAELAYLSILALSDGDRCRANLRRLDFIAPAFRAPKDTCMYD